MAAYNTLEFEAVCPSCNRQGIMKSQCHVASSFEKNTEGPLHNVSYSIGKKMRWWAETDPRYAEWRCDGLHVNGDSVEECCYTRCGLCNAKLFAVICFDRLIPAIVKQIGLEDAWPDGYPR